MTPTFWGICYHHEHHMNVVSLPLLHVSAVATIKELDAQVKLTQRFLNDATIPIEAVYSFPVPARAAVCGFTMVKQDGTRVSSIVQGRAEARETYDTALAEGKTASLAVQQTPDGKVFYFNHLNLLSMIGFQYSRCPSAILYLMRKSKLSSSMRRSSQRTKTTILFVYIFQRTLGVAMARRHRP